MQVFYVVVFIGVLLCLLGLGACYVLVLLVICCLVYVACFLAGYCLFACGLIWYWFLGVELHFVDILLLLWLLICALLLV